MNRSPLRDTLVRGLVETLLERISSLPPQGECRAETLADADSRLWNVAMSDWATTYQDKSAAIHSAADFIAALVAGLNEPQLVAAATDLSVTEHDMNYLARRAYDLADGGAGLPRLTEAIIGHLPADELLRGERCAQDAARVHLRDHGGKTWTDLDRIALRQSVIQALANIGDAFLTATENSGIAALPWRRLPDRSMRADTTVPDVPQLLSFLVKPVSDPPRSIFTPRLGPEFTTPFYPTNRRRRTEAYMCYVGVFTGAADDSDVTTELFDEWYSSGPYSQLAGQRKAAEIFAAQFAASHG